MDRSIAFGVILLPPRNLDPKGAAALIEAEDRIAFPMGTGLPLGMIDALGKRTQYRDVQVHSGWLPAAYPFFSCRGVTLRSVFFGPGERAALKGGADVHFVPGDFRRFSKIVRQFNPRVIATAASLPDADGYMSLSLCAGSTVDELRRCGADPGKLLIVETNPQLPRVLGLPPEFPHRIHVDEADVIIEHESAPPAIEETVAGELDQQIAKHAVRFVADGSTLQIGIGATPSAVTRILSEGSGGDYGIHSELFTTEMMRLHKAGKITNQKGLHDGYSVATVALGNRELYDWLDEQPDFRALPVQQTNDPYWIAKNRRMVSINAALEVDLQGQLVADRIGTREYSGIGGHEDFVNGASFSEGGHSIICLPSTARVGEKRLSRIVHSFEAGTAITTPRHQSDIIATEWGAAELAGRTAEERAEAMIEIAHPDVRDALEAGEVALPELPLLESDRA